MNRALRGRRVGTDGASVGASGGRPPVRPSGRPTGNPTAVSGEESGTRNVGEETDEVNGTDPRIGRGMSKRGSFPYRRLSNKMYV